MVMASKSAVTVGKTAAATERLKCPGFGKLLSGIGVAVSAGDAGLAVMTRLEIDSRAWGADRGDGCAPAFRRTLGLSSTYAARSPRSRRPGGRGW